MELRFDKHIYECEVTCKANGQSLMKNIKCYGYYLYSP